MSTSKNIRRDVMRGERCSQSLPSSLPIPLTEHKREYNTSKPKQLSKLDDRPKTSLDFGVFQKNNENVDTSNLPSPRVTKGHGRRLEKKISVGTLTRLAIDDSKTTGELKLCRRRLLRVPSNIWNIELPSVEDLNEWQSFKPLEVLDISHNAVEELAPVGPALQTLIVIDASDNVIFRLSNEISQCSSLKVLLLEENKLSYFPKCLHSLSNLTELNLRKNYMEQVPDLIGNLTSLKKLDVSCNKLTRVSYKIGCLSMLVTLSLSDNEISDLPDQLELLKSLSFLDISKNRLENLPRLNNMDNLSSFDASFNNIAILPDFVGCQKLTVINLEHNKIKDLIVDKLVGLPINSLLLKHNLLRDLPEDINRLSTVVCLDISFNRVKKLPYELTELRNLTKLAIYGNPIENVRRDVLSTDMTRIMNYLKRCSLRGDEEEKSKWITTSSARKSSDHTHDLIKEGVKTTRCLILANMNLTVLSSDLLMELKDEEIFRVDVSRNKFTGIPTELAILSETVAEIIAKQNLITAIPDFIRQMEHLKYLDISNNKIKILPLSMRTCHLKELVVESNCFQEIPEVVFSIQTLKRINFSGNRITVINVEGLKNLKRLSVLKLNNNNIDVVPPELGFLTHIKELELYGNPFRLPRYSVLSKGTEAVMAYLRNRTFPN